MQFSLIGEELEIELEKRDLDKLGFSFASFDYADPASRKIFRELLDIARAETGFCVPDSRLCIHFYEKRDGGALFHVRSRTEPTVERAFRFSDFEALSAARRRGLFAGMGGEVYRAGDAFFLLFDRKAREEMDEYAVPVVHPYLGAYLKQHAVTCDPTWFFGREEDARYDPPGMPFLHEL